MQYDIDLGLDWNFDAGAGTQHLNYLGSRKLTQYIEKILIEKYDIKGKKAKQYDEDIEIYNRLCELAELSLEDNLEKYVEKIQSWNNTTLFLSASDDMRLGLTEQICSELNSLGLHTNFMDLEYSDSYAAVIENGIVTFEEYSNIPITYTGKLQNNIEYTINSSGYLNGEHSNIIIEEQDYSTNGRGINIVVYDNESDIAIDSVRFDTFDIENAEKAIHLNQLKEEALQKYGVYLITK